MPRSIDAGCRGSGLPAHVRSLRADLADLTGNEARLLDFAVFAARFVVPLGLAIAFVVLGTGPEPGRNWYGETRGYDFSQVWLAGRLALEGRAAEAYDLTRHLANLAAAFGPDCLYTWHYPPVLLLPAAGLALLPYGAAFLGFTLGSIGLFALTLVLVLRRGAWVLVGLAHPLVFCNLAYGQNGLYTASLLTLGAMLVDRRPWLAGACFGLVAYKPHLAALAPLLLLATGRREALCSCLATVAGIGLLSLAAFGWAPWQGFLDGLGETNRLVLREAAFGLDFNASAFGAIRLLGGSLAMAWTAQVTVSLGALCVAVLGWRTGADPLLRAAVLLAAAPMLSPYAPIYDLAPLVPATILLVLAARRSGHRLAPAERWLLIVTPALALLRPATAATSLPVGFVLALATLACIAARLRAEGRVQPRPGSSSAPPAPYPA